MNTNDLLVMFNTLPNKEQASFLHQAMYKQYTPVVINIKNTLLQGVITGYTRNGKVSVKLNSSEGLHKEAKKFKIEQVYKINWSDFKFQPDRTNMFAIYKSKNANDAYIVVSIIEKTKTEFINGKKKPIVEMYYILQCINRDIHTIVKTDELKNDFTLCKTQQEINLCLYQVNTPSNKKFSLSDSCL